jgi:amino acid adenylation domain-containing protein
MPDRTVDSFQISPQQERVCAAEPDGPAARTQAVLAIDGAVDGTAIADALRVAVGRHESLRTTFARRPGLTLPLQVVNERLDPHIRTHDISKDDPRERAERLRELLRSELSAPLDLEQGPLVRAVLVVEDENAMKLIVTLSALCADETSASLLLREVSARLAGAGVAEDPLQYADFSAWQHELSDSDEHEARAARASWQELGPVSSPTLPFTSAQAHVGVGVGEQIEIEIDDTLTEALAAAAERYGTAAAALAQAAWHAVLGRFGAAESATVAFVPGERRHADLEGALGAFARPVPIETDVEGARSFAEVLAAIDRARGEALVMQDYAPAGGLGGVEIGFVEYPSHLHQPESLRLRIVRIVRSEPELRLMATCGTDGRRLTLSIAFDPARYRRETVSALSDGLVRMLRAAATDPSVSLAEVELLSDDERACVLREFNDTAANVPPECAHELIARWTLSAPDRRAVVDGESSITYAELDERANQLAHRLRGCGVGPEVAVGLCTDRSIEMVVGLVGILKAGGAYVPLHYEHPPARLRHQLMTTGASVLVTQEPLLGRLPEFEGEIVCLDRDRDGLRSEPSGAFETEISHDDLAYVIFTSGSTGAPKGVSVTHGNLINYTADIIGRLGADGEPLSFGLVTSVSTDLGNTSVFGALCSGGTLVLVSPDAATDPGALAILMEATPVDVLKITPSHVGALLAANDPRVLPRRWLVVGGERASWDLIDRVRTLSSCAILNHYGPTETTIGSCTFVVGEGPGEYEPASVPIGRPISNTSCYVLDDARRLTPVGVPGRLFIAGAGVAHGYVGAPDLTAERFSVDPFAPTGDVRMYDTGDLARWLPDGTLEFLDRADEQIKLRGYRVEPAEIETALRSHPQVREAVVATQTSAGGEPRLVAYCTIDGALDQDRLRTHLADWLPEFMLPRAIAIVDEMPRTPSGKIDKLALPDPDLTGAQSTEYVAPRTPMEEAVAAIWAQVLGVAQVGVEDDFFALGGHSLLATQVVARVRSDFAVDLPLHSLFTCPTVASLAAEIVRMMGDSEGDETARLMAELEGMSDEEAQRLLADDLSPGAG